MFPRCVRNRFPKISSKIPSGKVKVKIKTMVSKIKGAGTHCWSNKRHAAK